VALDSFICYILGRDPLKIATNRIAYEQGLSEADWKIYKLWVTIQ
jgi:uncharacterized protein (DUF362 family)